MAYDARLRWIQGRVMELLDVDKAKWDDLMARDEKAADGQLKDFLDKGPKGYTCFFLYHTVIDYIEQEVPGTEEPPAEEAEPTEEGEAPKEAPPRKVERVPVSQEVLEV